MDTCGTHLNSLFKTKHSNTYELLTYDAVGCDCVDGDKCKFYSSYAEGSSYDGYVARDKIHFGGNHTNITYTFGCVKNETNLFFRQRADGILGLSPGVK